MTHTHAILASILTHLLALRSRSVSVQYSICVIPSPVALSYLPGAATLEAVLAMLIDSQWANREQTFKVSSADESGNWARFTIDSQTMNRDLSDLVARGRAFEVALPGCPAETFWPNGEIREDGEDKKYDFADDPTAFFGPHTCSSISLLWSPALFAMPEDGYREFVVTCPDCGDDVSSLFPYGSITRLGRPTSHETNVRRCSACGSELPVDSLLANTTDPITGAPTAELAPFARFMLQLNPSDSATPQVYPHPIEDSLFRGLEAATGVPFRYFGRWH